MSRQTAPSDPRDMDLNAIIDGILAMSPPTLGGHDRARANLLRLKRTELDETFRSLRAELERTADLAEAARSRHAVLAAARPPKPDAATRGLTRLRAVRDAIRNDRAGRVPADPAPAAARNDARLRATTSIAGTGPARARVGEPPSAAPGGLHIGYHGPYGVLAGDAGHVVTGTLVATSSARAEPAPPMPERRDEGLFDIIEAVDNLKRSLDRGVERRGALESEFLHSVPISLFIRHRLTTMLHELDSMARIEKWFVSDAALWSSRGMEDPFRRHIVGFRGHGAPAGSTLLVESRPVLDDRLALEALARMSKVVSEYAPDVIVSLSVGGAILEKFLIVQMKETTVGRVVKRTVAFEGKDAASRRFRNASRILVIDDVVATADIMNRARAWVSDVAPNATCQAVALVSSVGAIQDLDTDWIYSSAVTPSWSVDLPWDNGGSYRHTSEGHVFGYGRQRKFPVADELYAEVARSIEVGETSHD